MRARYTAFSCLIAATLLGGCCYHLGERGEVASSYQTITVPYVIGDQSGALTQALIQEIATSGVWQYRRESGAFVLKVELLGLTEENIGFEYGTAFNGDERPRLVPDEGRLTAAIRVSLLDGSTGREVLAPICLRRSVDFDFDPLSTENQLSQFSLGQFVAIDEAKEVARGPLYGDLARQIVELLRIS